MQFKQLLVSLLFLVTALTLHSQTTYLPEGARENVLLERMEIKSGWDTVLNFSKNKPFSRKQFISHLGRLDSLANTSKVDAYNYKIAMLSNLEWATGRRDEYKSKRPVGKSFYQTPANL